MMERFTFVDRSSPVPTNTFFIFSKRYLNNTRRRTLRLTQGRTRKRMSIFLGLLLTEANEDKQ